MDGIGEQILACSRLGVERRNQSSNEFVRFLVEMAVSDERLATALVAAIGDAKQFVNGRQLAASLGLTPRQHSSGGKDRLLGISKRGDAYLRTLLVHGARSAIRTAKSKDDRLSQWAVRVAERSHPNVAAIALANKTARMAWAMLRHDADYQPERAAA